MLCFWTLVSEQNNYQGKWDRRGILSLLYTGENLDAVTAVTDSFKMADVFVSDWTGGAVAQTNAQMIGVSVWQGRMWVSRLQPLSLCLSLL